eukprot:TRINITY_DN2565_c0_g1_i5.p1 TRINITY_DN2565_c0_g1~~TRINITY_DN2565_c0_g1_i5.p1  ORF type:complete len:107 (+),score=24.69 TRINITY_DN2565_c0_g1_i5:41-361(+)
MSFYVLRGRVQNVMCRQTLMRAADRRGLTAGATNEPGGEVTLTLEGEEAQVSELVDAVRSGKPLNSWGAQVVEMVQVSEGREIAEHQVHSGNVDQIKWNPNVEMFI